MRKVKKLLNKFAFSFALIGCLLAGIFFANNYKPYQLSTSAEFASLEKISNATLPEYVNIKPSNAGSVGKEIYLFNADSSMEINIAEHEITSTKDASKKNYGYYTDEENINSYYYFEFQSIVALYYDLTNEEIINGATGENLLSEIDDLTISNFAKQHTSPFVPDGYSFTPQQLSIKFNLNTNQEKIIVSANTITLAKEGCYTLAIPTTIYETTNGITFVGQTKTLYYTFMVFNSKTYFDGASNKPNISPSSNIQESFANSTAAYSNYYFYNYSYGNAINTLPSISYNPERFQLKIEYADLDQKTSITNIEYAGGEVKQLNTNGVEIEERDQIVNTHINQDKEVEITFTKIGSYDISINYLYVSKNAQGETTYLLPLEDLEGGSFKNKPQKLYIYGYQTVFSDYSDIDESTNQPKSKPLQTYDLTRGTYSDSADITSALNNYISTTTEKADASSALKYKEIAKRQTATYSSNFDCATLAEYAQEFIQQKDGTQYINNPISTNQTPVKFLTNAKFDENYSKIYSVDYINHPTTEGIKIKNLTYLENFQGFNQNNAGTYLYIIQYKFDSYLEPNTGTLKSTYYHYQIFYFTITNSMPTISVKEFDNSDEKYEYNEIYTNGFTNKSVYILNNAQNNVYDADVEILVSAQNYKTGSYFFPATSIFELQQYGMSYQKFENAPDEEKYENYNTQIAGNYGILIENTSRYANALFTIQIESANTSKPSTRTFTIDTNGIENITARNAKITSSINYEILDDLEDYSTNQSFVLSWDEKQSGALTFGYLKHIPFTSINYYSSLDDLDLSLLLGNLMDSGTNTLPVSYKIDLEKASNWSEYINTKGIDNTIHSTYVKSNDGIYILEVYDQAGNSAFEIFMKDSTEPLFVKEIDGSETYLSLISNGETISVPEANTNVYIKWAQNKAFYLENIDEYKNFEAYKFGIDVEGATQKLQTALIDFFESNADLKRISSINNVSTVQVNPGEAGIPTGINSYNGTYLLVPIDNNAYIKTATSSDYSKTVGTSFEIKFVDEENKAIEGTYKILIRDASNNIETSNEATNFKQYPSGYLSFNVSSDASKLTLHFDEADNLLDYANYNFTGKLYSYEKDSKTFFTHLPTRMEVVPDTGAKTEESNSETNLTYKFMYNTPVNASQPINLSYIPVALNGSEIASIVLKYYPYKLDCNEEGGKYFWYYTIDDAPARTINVFTKSSKVYAPGAEETFSIALGTDELPLAGRYVIERLYTNGNNTDKYDYFKRTITFLVDDFSLISPVENIDGEPGKSSLESVVGGDIILSMYSGEGMSDIEVSFPSYNENGLNNGSFYTKESFAESELLTVYSIEGNKLPMTLHIPERKYTVSTASTINRNTKSYSVKNNNILSYYGNATVELNSNTGFYDVVVEGVTIDSFGTEADAWEYIEGKISISEYKIMAKIEAVINETGSPETKYFATKADSLNGFLKIYPADSFGNIENNASPVEYFWQKGNYVVTLYQASNDTQSNFYSLYKFGFKIISQEPDFTISDANGYDLKAVDNTNKQFYTNSNELTISWQLPKNKYQAEIDESAISVVVHPTGTSITQSAIEEKTGSKYFTIDTSSLLDRANSYVEITMQYKAYNSTYYTKVTKKIYFDKTAPTGNLQNLMKLTASSTNISLEYQLEFMRKYYDQANQEVKVQTVEDLSKASYSYSISNGYFKYYSYVVTKDFFTSTLKESLNQIDNYETSSIYYKEISSLDSYLQVDKLSFAERNYLPLRLNYQPTIRCGYYEVVELDYAGNMTVYVVYVIDSSDPEDPAINTTALSYINNLHGTTEISNAQIQEGLNIYSNSGFQITSLSYQSDPWAMINVSLHGRYLARYMKSPWLNTDAIYKVTFGVSGIDIEEVMLSDMFKDVKSSANKHQIAFVDRIAGNTITTYLSVMDASISTQKIEDPEQSSAIINISMPSEREFNSTTTSYVYPTSMTVYQYNSVDGEWATIMIADQKQYGIWEARTAPTDYSSAMEYMQFAMRPGNILQVKINLGQNKSEKIKYEITDNFGNVTTVIQLANEVSYREIEGLNAVYQYTEVDNSITYISSDTIKFSYNEKLYAVKIFDDEGEITDSMSTNLNKNADIATYTFNKPTGNIYDVWYKIEVRDVEEPDAIDPTKTLYVRIVYNLPFLASSQAEVYNGGILFNDKNQQPINSDDITRFESFSVSFNGKTYTSSGYSISAYDNVTLRFKDGQDYAHDGVFAYNKGFPYSIYLSKDNGLTWENINSETSAISGHTIREVGEYIILAIYDDETAFQNLCKIFTVSVIDQDLFPLYSIRVDNLPVSQSDIKFTSRNNIEYEVNYIVSVDYYTEKDFRLAIIENSDKQVSVMITDAYQPTGSNVYVEIYHYISAKTNIEGDFTIIYIKETSNIISTFTYNTAVGTSVAIKDESYVMIAADNETEVNFDKLKLNFNSYYGIKENKIKVEVLKLFDGSYVEINKTPYYEGENAYIYLEKSGSYRVKLIDSCAPANVHKFKSSDFIEIVFLNSVPFIVSYTNDNGENIKTAPIQRAVYNSAVKLELQNLHTNSYYQASGYPQISVKLNGKAYTGYSEENRVYTFTTPGIYTVKFKAVSKTNHHTGVGVQIREEEYSFSIITKNEIKSSYEFSEYSNYYIEKVEREGVDITNNLVEMGNYKTVMINGKKYLSGLSLANSIQDEKTGDGRYTITINHNMPEYQNVVGRRFTYQIRIGYISQIPINISISEGAKTTKPILITYNVRNLYDTVGDCYIKIGDEVRVDYNEGNINEYGEIATFKINGTGTHYIKLYTASGNLLFSYKVTKSEPLNAFAIIAIVLGICALVAIIAITIKIRKRQRAK